MTYPTIGTEGEQRRTGQADRPRPLRLPVFDSAKLTEAAAEFMRRYREATQRPARLVPVPDTTPGTTATPLPSSIERARRRDPRRREPGLLAARRAEAAARLEREGAHAAALLEALEALRRLVAGVPDSLPVARDLLARYGIALDTPVPLAGQAERTGGQR